MIAFSWGSPNSNFTFGLMVDISMVNEIINQLITGGDHLMIYIYIYLSWIKTLIIGYN